MLRVEQFPYGADNLGYLVHGVREAAAIDPGEAGPILKYLRANGLLLQEIWNTHSHGDHTCGNRVLAEVTRVEIIGSGGPGSFKIEGEGIEVIPTPGHTADSAAYYHPGWVITGDTLFIANAGNCASEMLPILRRSLDRLLSSPGRRWSIPATTTPQDR